MCRRKAKRIDFIFFWTFKLMPTAGCCWLHLWLVLYDLQLALIPHPGWYNALTNLPCKFQLSQCLAHLTLKTLVSFQAEDWHPSSVRGIKSCLNLVNEASQHESALLQVHLWACAPLCITNPSSLFFLIISQYGISSEPRALFFCLCVLWPWYNILLYLSMILTSWHYLACFVLSLAKLPAVTQASG